MPSVQKTLEHFTIDRLDIFKCTSVVELFIEFKRAKTLKITCLYFDNEDEENDDKLAKLKLNIKQSEEKLNKTHSKIKIDIRYEFR